MSTGNEGTRRPSVTTGTQSDPARMRAPSGEGLSHPE